MNILVRLLLIGLIMFLVVLGYSYKSQQAYSLAKNPLIATNTVHIVNHSLGKTIVPLHPQRVVILDDSCLDNALAVGIVPIGAPKIFFSDLKADLKIDSLIAKKIVDVGFLPTNIEKILALKPDLILGLDVTHQDIYPLLSHIAPTVLIHINSVQDWQDNFMRVATILGKSDRAQKVINDYKSRLLSLKTAMGVRLSSVKVSLINVGYGARIIRVLQWDKDSFAISILQQVGLARMILPTMKVSEHWFQIISLGVSNISEEDLLEIDGDIILVVLPGSSFSQAVIDTHQKAIKQLQATPLWSKLKAVQQAHVYQVGLHWIGNGSIAANLALDDLFKYLCPMKKV